MSETFTRRQFLYGTTAFFATHGLFAGGSPNLRVGIVSDVHLATQDRVFHSARRLEEVLRRFDAMKADGVLACGDLTDFGTVESLELFGAIWDKVFPGGRRSDGAPIAKLFHCGDHDAGGYAHKWDWAKEHCADPQELSHPLTPEVLPQTWQRAFGEAWSPVVVKDVKGYRFVLANHPPHVPETKNGMIMPGLDEAILKANADPSRFLFYSQHRPIFDTLCFKGMYSYPESRKALEQCPNVVAFHGHMHLNCADEQNLWQGAFTAVSVPSLSYCCTRPGHENGTAKKVDGREVVQLRDGLYQSSQYLFMDVFGDRAVVARYEATHHESMGVDWVVPFAGRGGLTAEARAGKAVAPQFAPTAKVKAETSVAVKDRKKRPQDCVRVSFPPAHATAASPRAYDYEVCVGDLKRRVFSSNSFWSDARDTKDVYCLIRRDELPESLTGLDVSVCPFNAYGQKGRAISCRMTAEAAIELEGEWKGGHLQDVWMAGETIWWAHTQHLVKTDRAGRIVKKAEVGGHHAGLEVKDGRLYSAVCAFNGEPRAKTTPACHVMIGEYDAETLERIEMHVLDINDRSGSFCFLEDGTFLVGCLRHPSLKPSEVKFHHVGRDYKLIKTHVVDVGKAVELGIEVIRREGDEIFLFIYGGPVMKLDAKTFAVTGRYKSFGGQMGYFREGPTAWVAESKRDPETKRWKSRLVGKRVDWKPAGS